MKEWTIQLKTSCSRAEVLALVRQLILEKGNSGFKPILLHKNDLLSHSIRGGGGMGTYIPTYIHTKDEFVM